MPKTLDKDLALRKAKSAAASRGGECLSTEYVNAVTKMQWRCGEGHLFDASYTAVLHQDTWCKACAGLFRSVRVKTYVRPKRVAKATKPRAFKTSKAAMSYQIMAKELQRTAEDTSGIRGINAEEQRELKKEENGFLRAYMPTGWCCPQGHTWNATFNAVRVHGFGCKKCRTDNNKGDEE